MQTPLHSAVNSRLYSLFLSCFFFVITGCVQQEKIIKDEVLITKESNSFEEESARYEARLTALQNEKTTLSNRLDRIINGPSGIVRTANRYIKNGDGKNAIQVLNILLQNNPSSKEAAKAKSLAAKAKRLLAVEKAQVQQNIRFLYKRHLIISEESDTGTTWYKAKLDQNNNHTRIVTYFGQNRSSPPALRMKLKYHADDWLFIQSLFIIVDGDRYDFNQMRFKRDYSDGYIWEWSDNPANKKEQLLLKHIANSKSAIIRFQGRNSHKDYTISKDEKRAIKHILDAFKHIKNSQ